MSQTLGINIYTHDTTSRKVPTESLFSALIFFFFHHSYVGNTYVEREKNIRNKANSSEVDEVPGKLRFHMPCIIPYTRIDYKFSALNDVTSQEKCRWAAVTIACSETKELSKVAQVAAP